ncbi:MAG TPA: plastocyanin/azurin family copper-binding protein, partial [Flavobacteriaceae bacterium]|nr:plastocyanin/azurin family copper-binding protein [Flavobacteriaceae bacterium]
MKKITLLCMFMFAGLTAIAQTTHNLNWYMGITSADASLTINTGDTVIWTFTDAPSHSVTSDAGSTETFDSGILSGIGTTFSHTFTAVGTNPYHCNVHAGMVGTITVVAPTSFLIDDDFESYTAGPMGTQATWWTTWSGTTGGTEDIEVSTLQANSGTQSGLIAEGSVQDALLLLGNKTSGVYEISWDMYVPTGKVGYWNIQESETPGVAWNADFYVGDTASGGTAGLITHDQSGVTIPYTSDTWFNVKLIVDLNNYVFSAKINNTPFLISEPYPGVQLGAMNFYSTDANNRYFIDDVLFEQASCIPPTNIATSVTSTTTVDVSWTAGGTATTWEIEYGAPGFTLGSGTVVIDNDGVTGNTITGLSASTAYELYIRTDCGGGDLSAWVGPFAFNTPCATIIAPYTEDFENAGAIPNCWAQGSANAEDWKFDDTVGSNHIGNSGDFYGTTSASGGYFAWVDDSSSHSLGTTLETPSVDVSGLTTPALSFYIVSDNEGNTNVDFSVDFYDGAAWNTAVYTSNTNTGGWIKVFVDLSAYTITGPVKARFIVDENNGTDFYDDVAIDDVAFLELPTCFMPTTLTTANITDTTVDLGWTDANTPVATTWDVHVVPAGDPAPTATTTPSDPGVTTNPYNKTGLLPVTAYDFYVRADCGGGDFSIWSNPFSFTTICPTAFTPAYTQDFSVFVPLCWEEATSGLPSAGPGGLGSGSWTQDDFANTGTNQAANISLSGSSDEDWLISPAFDLSAGGYELTFIAAITDSGNSNPPEDLGMGSDDEVQILISIDNGTTWTNLLTYNQSDYPSETGQLEFIDLATYTSATTKFAIWGSEGTVNDPESYEFFIDNFEVRTKPSCGQPNNLAVTNTLATSADLGWTENNVPPVALWDVHVVLAGDPAPIGTTVPSDAGVTTNPYNKTGLTSSTSYEFYVRADCGGGDLSTWTGPYAFTTTPTNDDLANAIALTMDAVCSGDAYTNVGATAQTGEPSGSCFSDNASTVDNSVWFSFVAPASGNVFISTDIAPGVLDDSEIAVYAAPTNLNDLSTLPAELGCDQDGGNIVGSGYMSFLKLFGLTSGNTYYIQVDGYDGSSGAFCIEVSEITCLSPSTLTAANITATTADLGWTENNVPPATTWDVHVVPDGDPAPTATTTPTDAGVTTNPYAKTSLTSNTDYEFYVRTDCGGGDFSFWTGPFAFTTPCATFTLPFIETFDDSDTPTCWTESGDNSWDFSLSADYAASAILDHTPGGGTDYAWMDGSDNGNGEVSTLTSPMVDVSTLTTPALQFFLFSNNTNDGAINTVDVEFYDGATWNNVLNLTTLLGPDWVKYLIDLSAYTITGDVQVRFTVTGNSAGGSTFHNDILLDDVSFLELPSCLVPTTLTAAAITTSSADLGWTDTNTPAATMWDVHVVTAGSPAPDATTTPSDPGVTVNPHPKTGLTSGTTYEFYVRADCGGGTTSLWAGPFMFSTVCVNATLPYSESFTSGIFPVCWTRSSTTDVTIEATCDTRTNVLNISDTNDATTGDIDGTTSTTGLKVSYYIGEDLCGGATEDPFDVEYWDGTQWVLAKTYEIVGTGLPYDNAYFHDSFIVPQSAVTATFKVRFSSNETQALDNWYIDDLVVENAPTCLQPTALTATNIFATSTDLGWTDGNTPAATTWDIEVVTAGTTPTGTPTDVGVTTNPYNKTGLTAQTAYEFYVRTDCGGGDLSAWAGPFAFTTACTAVVAPWSEDFSNGGVIPNCWEQGAANGEDWEFDNTTGFNHIGDNGTIIGNSQSDGYFAWVDDSSPNNIGTTLLSPFIDVSGLSFSELTFYRLSNNEGNTNVDFSVDVWDGAAWNNDMYFSNTNSANGGWEKITVDLSTLTISGDIQIRFVVDENNGTDFYDDVAIDDVDVHERPCYDPSNLTVSNISQTTADISWIDNAQASEWEIEYGPTGFAQGSGTIVLDNDGTLGETLSPLTPATVYDVYVRALCASGDTSGWIGPVTFTTACATLTTLPYTESFESTSPYRVCWKNEYVSSDEDWEFVAANQNGTITPRTGTSMAEFSTT